MNNKKIKNDASAHNSSVANCYMQEIADCKLCKGRGKHWNGSDPTCAFKNGIFDTNNWNCATANALRELVAENAHFDNDQSCGVKPLGNANFMVVSWYKSRDRVEGIWIVEGEKIRPIYITEAEEILGV